MIWLWNLTAQIESQKITNRIESQSSVAESNLETVESLPKSAQIAIQIPITIGIHQAAWPILT